jgi:transposase
MFKKSSTFIHELPLKVNPHQEVVLLKRLEAARQIYNACLGEALKRLRLLKESKAFQEAKTFPHKSKQRRHLLKVLNKEFGFTDYDIQSYGIKCKNSCWIKLHLDTHVCQKMATRAFKAVQEYAFGRRGRPRFKGKNQLDTVEGKSNASGIKWRNSAIVWKGLVLPVILDRKDKHGVQEHALSCPVKYCRIVRRKFNGKNRFYVQLVLKGKPKIKDKNKIANAVVGLDLGPSTIAAFCDTEAVLKPFCAELEPLNRQIRLIQRKLDRSRRATNPDNYNEDGTIKKGRLSWHFSRRYIKERTRLANLLRKQAAYRDSLQGRLVNEILSMGKFINTEKISYRTWQKNFGKSIGFRAPGKFMEKLRYKAESAGGGVNEFPTFLRLSQFCHVCGTYTKKPLSQRWHDCECGTRMQRDLYSAYLARFVSGASLDTSHAVEAWPGAESLLWRAVSRLNETASGRQRLASFGLNRRQSGSHAEDGSTRVEAVTVVASCERYGETRDTAVRTPRL